MPVKHCSFKGCKEAFADDGTLIRHLTATAAHLKLLEPVAERIVLPEADKKIEGQSHGITGALRIASAYNEGIAVAVRRGAPHGRALY